MSRDAGNDEVEEVIPTFGRGIYVVCLDGSPITLRRFRPLWRQPSRSGLRRKSRLMCGNTRISNKHV
jgi:hypothetical protein